MEENKRPLPGVTAKFISAVDPVLNKTPKPKKVTKAEQATATDRKETNGTEWIEPDFDLRGLAIMATDSTILPQCINVYGDNIAGFGLRIRYKEDTPGEETEEQRAEWSAAQRVLDLLSDSGSAAKVFVEAVKQREACGIGYIECVRDAGGRIVSISNVIDASTIRMSKMDTKATEYTRYYNGEELKRMKRFRHYKQDVNGNVVYFKEFGDPRTMDCTTGEYVDGSLDISKQANELLTLTIGLKHYGTVRWIGQVTSVDGSHAAENLNGNYFHNGRHMPMMIMVQGGRLTDSSKKELQTYLSTVKGEQAQFGFLLCELEAKEGNTAFEGTERPTVEIKDLSPMLQKDALFTEYLESNRKKAQSAFRLPDVYLAYTTDYNRSTVYAAIQLTEEQVFTGEREQLSAVVNNQLLNSYGWKYIEFYFDSPNLVDPDTKSALISSYAAAGGLTPNLAKTQMYNVLGLGDAEPYEGEWADVPLVAWTAASASVSAIAEKTEPNEEQPVQADEETVDSLEEAIEKAERDDAQPETIAVLRGIYRELRRAREAGGMENEA